MDQDASSRATSFGGWAEEYDASRPSYPDAAVEWLVGDARDVIEVAAGTGQLTDRLVGAGLSALVVTEIDRRMLSLIEARHPAIDSHEAGATDLPVSDGSADAILVADAWQWFPKAEAAAEATRVLRPGGWLGCVWNDKSAATPDWQWDALRLSPEIAAEMRGSSPIERLELSSGRAEQKAHRWAWTVTPRQFREWVATISHVRTLPPRLCQQALENAERLATQACAGTGSPTVTVEFDAVCIRWLPHTL